MMPATLPLPLIMRLSKSDSIARLAIFSTETTPTGCSFPSNSLLSYISVLSSTLCRYSFNVDLLILRYKHRLVFVIGSSLSLCSAIQPFILSLSSATLVNFRRPPLASSSCLSICFPSTSVKRVSAALICGLVRLHLLNRLLSIPMRSAIFASESPSPTHRLICSSRSGFSHSAYLHFVVTAILLSPLLRLFRSALCFSSRSPKPEALGSSGSSASFTSSCASFAPIFRHGIQALVLLLAPSALSALSRLRPLSAWDRLHVKSAWRYVIRRITGAYLLYVLSHTILL